MDLLSPSKLFSQVSHLNRIPSRLLILMLCLALAPGMTGCKGKKKKAAEEQARIEALAAAEREAYLNGIRNQLNDIINYTATDLDDLGRKDRQLGDLEMLEDWQESDILVQIRKAKYHLAQERDRLTSISQQPVTPALTPQQSSAKSNVSRAFDAISGAGSTSEANSNINQALSLFSSPDAPVLIIISEAGDYDRPTTISRYLNYLKDQRRNPNVVNNVVLDNQGRIREIELIKSQLRP